MADTRTSVSTGTLNSRYNPDQVLQVVKMATREEVILSYRGKKRPMRWHTCTHTKFECLGFGNGLHYINGDWFYLNHVPLYGYGKIPVVSADVTCTTEQWESVMDHMDLGIATKVSLPNFLFDCADMAELFKGFKRSHRNKLPKEHRQGSWLDRAGALWLLYNYGIKPFVSDLSAILHCQQKVQRKAQAMRDIFGKNCRCKTRFTPNVSSYGGVLASPSFASFTIKDGTPHNTATGIFLGNYIPTSNYDVSGLTLACNYLGINKWGDVLWDAIPFSFCADWFIDTQRWVRGVNLSNWQGGVIWLGAGCTAHQKFSCTHDVFDTGSTRALGGAQEIVTQFSRTSGVPPISDGKLTNDRFGARQLSYAAVLFNQIMGKYR